MAKLKLGAIADDKPVKITIELPRTVHRDLRAYARGARSRNRTADRGSLKTGRTDAGAIHGDGPRVCKSSA